MGTDEREKLERKLLQKLKVAEKDYRTAGAEHQRVKALSSAPFDDVLYRAALKEQIALDRYIYILKLFSDLINHDLPPDANDIPR